MNERYYGLKSVIRLDVREVSAACRFWVESTPTTKGHTKGDKPGVKRPLRSWSSSQHFHLLVPRVMQPIVPAVGAGLSVTYRAVVSP